MERWQIVARAAVVIAIGTSAAMVGVAEGQTARIRAQTPRALEIITGGNRLGVAIRDLENADGSAIKGATSGVVIEDVSNDSPAQKAGMRKGDVIVEFDGERVRSARQLRRLVQETPAGRSVSATVVRDGQRTNLNVTPSDSGSFSFDRFDFDDPELRGVPKPPAPPAPPVPPSVRRFDELLGRTSRLGVTIDTLSPQLAEYFGTKAGVLVTSVSENSVAAKAGLKAGDVITSLNGSPVDEPGDVRRRIQDLQDGAELSIGVTRDRKPLTLKGKMERAEPRRTVRTVL